MNALVRTVLAATILALSLPALGAGPDPAMFDPFTEFRTWYANSGPDTVIRIDAEGPYITMDGPDFRFHFDGTDLWYQPRWHHLDPTRPNMGPPPPTKLHPAAAAMARDFWEEMRSGFANTTFTEEYPPATDRTFARNNDAAQRWYRMRLPFAWDDKLLVYIGTASRIDGTSPKVYLLKVLDGAGQPALILPQAMGGYAAKPWNSAAINFDFHPKTGAAVLNVPLAPDAYHPDQMTSAEALVPSTLIPLYLSRDLTKGAPNYHDALRRAAIPYDEAASDGWHDTGGPDGFAAPGLTVESMCGQPGTHAKEGTLLWRFPQSSDQALLVAEAVQTCDEVRFQMSPRIYVNSRPGARACVQGTWEVLDTTAAEPVVLWSTDLDVCRDGASPAELVPFKLDAAILGSVTGPDLAIRYTGRSSVTCHASPNAGGRVKSGSKGPLVSESHRAFDPTIPAAAEVDADSNDGRGPFIWWSCWPGWPYQDTSAP